MVIIVLAVSPFFTDLDTDRLSLSM